MAHLRRDSKSGNYFIRFRYAGRSFNRSLKTPHEYEAEAFRGRIEETILLIERGRIEMPNDVDPAYFILSDGKQLGRPIKPKVSSLNELIRIYNDEMPLGAKEKDTLKGEKRHQALFLKHLRGSIPIQSFTTATMQSYVASRSKDKWNGVLISPETITKELTTFKLIWNWAAQRGYVVGTNPTKGVNLPKRSEKLPFMTKGEIDRKISRNGLTEEQVKRLWESLFLKKEEICKILDGIRSLNTFSFIYPMFVFVAHTGARRSEILRSRIEDFDFDTKIVKIREKKKVKNRNITFRHVDMTPLLYDIMKCWFENHPGGQFTICDDPEEISAGLDEDELGMSKHKAQYHFKETLARIDWSKIRGFHVFRHSFASNLASAGVDQRVIDEWMGHQTEEMRRRYRHLFPQQRRSAIELVFGGSGQ
ncbi:tyrosine-type recombinase/integrase [Gimesia algae]|uniref:Site-specific tyrosine recombinase XerC n=1 Tax=Gimesia algae TaxID=2527971 RepID=A0A517VFD8_9PLAN|nr:tyrosine-type recombinase/integrase [Gimesia algae]QDT91722.1 site-specific tyrosine recombinase XerC [Gimesia algae]